MSVLIKGMEMPKSCKSCDLLQDYDGDMYCPLNNYLNFGDIENVPDYVMIGCPLSEQPEVIRCTECKHYREYDSEYVENAVVVQCMADRYPISETIPDGWFCAGAERRSDG